MNIVVAYSLIACIPFLTCAGLYLFTILTEDWFDGMFDDLDF